MQPSQFDSASLVTSIFAALRGNYGASFDRKMLDCPSYMDEATYIQQIMAIWADKLSGVSEKSIRYALNNLPPKFPPDLPEFHALCLQAPSDNPAYQLDYKPAPVSASAKRRLESALSGIGKQASGHAKQWAHDLRAKEKSGFSLTAAQRNMWREALGLPANFREETKSETFVDENEIEVIV